MDERNYQHSYENGSTKPPKNRGGVIAVVLCTVILLGGMLSLLAMWDRANTHANSQITDVLFFGDGNTDTVTSTPDFQGTTQTPVPDVQVELTPVPGQVENVPQVGGMGLQDIYDKNIPAVVSITCTLNSGSSSGTGVVLSESGYLVTNAHVVEGAQSIEVLLTDGRTFAANLVGADSLSDLAVLYINATDLTPAEFGDSSQIRVGDAVVAIGDPLGVAFRGTMTDGIVSAINRDVQSEGRTMTLIQTNAALNSGNSGGPLINCFGQVIGINTMKIGIYADDAGVEGLGFAIPSSYVKEIVDQLISQGYVSGRPSLGLTGQWVSSFNQQFRRIPAGLYITHTPENSQIQAQDIIMYVDGVRVTNQDELNTVLYAHQAGDTVTLILYRNGRQYNVDITLAENRK